MSQRKPNAAQPAESVDIDALRESLRWCDMLSQESNNRITALVQLTLATLTGPDGLRLNDRIDHLENIYHCLQTISELAFDCKNGINCAAEDHGCNHEDSTVRRRRAERGAA